MQKFISTRLFRVLCIAAIFIGLVFLNPVTIFNPIRSTFVAVLEPFQKFFYSFSMSIENIKEFAGEIGQLKNENENLRKENRELLASIAMYEDIKKENDNLREQINILPREKYDLVAAFLVSRDSSGTENWIEIDKGSDDGVAPGMPVIVSKSIIIGRVYEVGAKNSKIMLLTNPKSTLNVIALEKEAKGIVRGEYGLGVILDMVLQADSINAGDKVVTSGIGGEIPRGLFVGTIQEVRPSEDHLFQQGILIAPIQI